MYSAFPWLGFIFWLGLFSWLGTKAWARYLAEQERQKTLRVFAERGTPLDREMMEKLFPTVTWQHVPPSWQPSPESGPRGLAIGGIVVLFAGIGLLIGAQLIGRIQPDALFGMSTGGVMACSFGLGLIVASRTLRRMQARDRARTSGTGDDAR